MFFCMLLLLLLHINQMADSMNRYQILLLDVEDAETGMESQKNMEYQDEILNKCVHGNQGQDGNEGLQPSFVSDIEDELDLGLEILDESKEQEPETQEINCDQTSGTEITRKDEDQRDDELRMNEYTRPVEESLTNDKETGEVKCADNLLNYISKRKTKGKVNEQIKWDGALQELHAFDSFILKLKGKWKMTGKGKSIKHTFEETNTKFKLNRWPTSSTISLQGKTEEVEKIERKIDLIISGTGGIVTENEDEEDRVGHDDGLSCETTQKHEENSTETQPPDTKKSKIATENANKRKCFQKEIRDDIKALWDTLEQLKNLIVTISNNAPTSIQPISRDNKTDDSIENKNEGKEKQDENHKEITRKAKSRTMRDSLITEFLKPIDKMKIRYKLNI